MSEFKILCNYINDNDVILRDQMVHYLGLYMPTCDPYRRKLEVVGFIKKDGRGRYLKIKQIPDNYTTTKLYSDYSKVKSCENPSCKSKDMNCGCLSYNV